MGTPHVDGFGKTKNTINRQNPNLMLQKKKH